MCCLLSSLEFVLPSGDRKGELLSQGLQDSDMDWEKGAGKAIW